jgi:hypothetical protein
MAILRVPKITTLARKELVFLEAEIVFDTDLGIFFGGDGTTQGGIELGSQGGIRIFQETFTITQENINSGLLVLARQPISPSTTSLVPTGGPPQVYGVDFEVINDTVSFNGLGLENFLEVGEKLIITYSSLPNI